jgi:hypothetical protein
VSEVDEQWRKSSFSDGPGCVEVSMHSGEIRVRDSKHPSGAVLTFTPYEWQAFLQGVSNQEFRLPAD